MKHNRWIKLLLLPGAMLALYYNAKPLPACGPFFLAAVFHAGSRPDMPFDDFVSGSIGVVPPSYWRTYLVVAFRRMNGIPAAPEETRTVAQTWQNRYDRMGGSGHANPEPLKLWLEKRNALMGGEPVTWLEVQRPANDESDYYSYLNCNEDAFRVATETLAARSQTFGANSPQLKAWLAAQEQVFDNCDGGKVIPSALPAGAPALARQDRAYQIAAAHFYAAEPERARALFDAIAADRTSPWRDYARIAAARAAIRHALMKTTPEAARRRNFADAERRLQALAADPALARFKPSVNGLLALLRTRGEPQARLRELAARLASREPNPTFAQDLVDYTRLLNPYEKYDDATQQYGFFPTPTLQQDELTRWLAVFQSRRPQSVADAMQEYTRRKTDPWLVAALSKLANDDPRGKTLCADLDQRPKNAAYPSIAYHCARLAAGLGELERAHEIARATLNNAALKLPLSAQNHFSSIAMLSANRTTDFFAFALRKPNTFSFNDNGDDGPAALDWEGAPKPDPAQALFDADSVFWMNRKLPLNVLIGALESDRLPAHLRRELAVKLWTRAFLLGDYAAVDRITPLVRTLESATASFLDAYKAARTPEEKQYAALYLVLKFPSFDPYIDANRLRETPANELDDYRDNWWCGVQANNEVAPENDEAVYSTAGLVETITPKFLSASERDAGASQYLQLTELGAAPTHLCRETIAWAETAPADPRVPEALYRCVRATRLGCTDERNGEYSRHAFQILHRNYPASEWAQKTPYWFN